MCIIPFSPIRTPLSFRLYFFALPLPPHLISPTHRYTLFASWHRIPIHRLVVRSHFLVQPLGYEFTGSNLITRSPRLFLLAFLGLSNGLVFIHAFFVARRLSLFYTWNSPLRLTFRN